MVAKKPHEETDSFEINGQVEFVGSRKVQFQGRDKRTAMITLPGFLLSLQNMVDSIGKVMTRPVLNVYKIRTRDGVLGWLVTEITFEVPTEKD